MPDAELLGLAVTMGCDPQEILDEWPAYWVNRLLIYTNARAIAADWKR